MYTAVPCGVESQLVKVEIDVSYGLLQWNIVGLPDAAIKESRQRIGSALKNSGIKLPDRKITINLAPASLKKEGTLFDLPIAIGILQAFNIIKLPKEYIEESIWIGELALDGSVSKVRGALPIACNAYSLNKKNLFVPYENLFEVSVVKSVNVYGIKSIKHLIEVCSHEHISFEKADALSNIAPIQISERETGFADVKGQEEAKRALHIAAAGNHNIMLIGSPGSGKTMLAERLASIMPRLSQQEQIDVSKIYSVVGKLPSGKLISQRPFRAPHHTISFAGLVGGGSNPQPGEISFAHKGVLFLDELLEFKKSTLEVLRQPLESGSVTISRAHGSVVYPADFLLVAAMNPCPCGFFGDEKKTCVCSHNAVQNYLQKLSGPLLDRIDLQVGVYSMSYDEIQNKQEESACTLKDSVAEARDIQMYRLKNKTNARISSKEIEEYCKFDVSCNALVKMMFEQMGMTMRSYHKLLKVARTVADIEKSDVIKDIHLQEAYSYQTVEKNIT